MEIEKIVKCTKVLDGEKFYFLDQKIYDKINCLQELDEVVNKEIIIDYLEKHILFLKQNKEFFIALYRPNLQAGIWFTCIVYFYENAWRRVHIEFTECEFCDWKGKIANPDICNLYISLPRPYCYEVMRNAASLTSVNCPKCKKKLKRHAIWTEI